MRLHNFIRKNPTFYHDEDRCMTCNHSRAYINSQGMTSCLGIETSSSIHPQSPTHPQILTALRHVLSGCASSKCPTKIGKDKDVQVIVSRLLNGSILIDFEKTVITTTKTAYRE